jgi:hypothetical protein
MLKKCRLRRDGNDAVLSKLESHDSVKLSETSDISIVLAGGKIHICADGEEVYRSDIEDGICYNIGD